MISSYAVHIYLARLLGPEKYGVFGICLSIITICYVFLGSGVRQVVSKSVAKQKESAKYLLKRGLGVQLAMSITLGILVILSAKTMAQISNDMSLELPLYISAVIIITQSIFFVYMGILNGLKEFAAENFLLSTYSIVKAFVAIVFVYLGFAVIGGLSGFLVASFVSFIFGVILTRNLPGDKEHSVKISDMLRGTLPIIVIFSAKTIMMNVDLMAVKFLMAGGQFAGYYTSAAAISKLTYWYFVAFGVVLLPFVSSTYHNNNTEMTQNYVNKAIRYSLLTILPIVFIISFYANEFIFLIYGDTYNPAGIVLRILIWGLLGIGLLYLFANIMVGIGQEKIMIRYAVAGILLAVFLNCLLVPRIGVIGAALSTTLSSTLLTFIVFRYIARKLRIATHLASIFRVAVALLILSLGAVATRNIDISCLIKSCILYFFYGAALFFLKEITNRDISVVKNLVLSTSGIE